MRLFIGLEPTPVFRSALADLQERLRAAGVEGRYLAPSNLHLTLAFIGQWPEKVTGLLPSVGRPFPITLSHLGIFTEANVLWAGVEPSEDLDALAALVRTRLDEAEIPYDHQGFNAHITLIRKPVLPAPDLLSSIAVPRAVMTVREVCLYESVHESDGMKYTVIGRSGESRNVLNRSAADC